MPSSQHPVCSSIKGMRNSFLNCNLQRNHLYSFRLSFAKFLINYDCWVWTPNHEKRNTVAISKLQAPIVPRPIVCNSLPRWRWPAARGVAGDRTILLLLLHLRAWGRSCCVRSKPTRPRRLGPCPPGSLRRRWPSWRPGRWDRSIRRSKTAQKKFWLIFEKNFLVF